MAIKNNDDAREIPSPPSGERVRVRGQRGQFHNTANTALAPPPPATSPANFARNPPMPKNAYGVCFATVVSPTSNSAANIHAASTSWISIARVAKLAVELDGGGHGFPDQRARDEKRNRFLSEQGIKVLRFWNHQLRDELEAVRFEIWHALMERTGQDRGNRWLLAQARPLTPTLSPDGGEGVRTSNARMN